MRVYEVSKTTGSGMHWNNATTVSLGKRLEQLTERFEICEWDKVTIEGEDDWPAITFKHDEQHGGLLVYVDSIAQ